MSNKPNKLYPNCDSSVWLRSCEEEILNPVTGEIQGEIPKWLNGTLLRNGPGSIKVGNMEFQHLFDSSALLHRFHIENGTATYQCKFLRSETWKKNQAANRIVVSEFGTAAVPDPCKSIFDRVSSIFKPLEGMSDNAMISVYPFRDEMYAFTESPFIHRIDPDNLNTLERRNVSDYVAVVNHTSHPHVDANGDVYNLGLTFKKGRPQYAVVKFPATKNESSNMFENAEMLTSVDVRWPLHPSYMHTFGMTENYFIIIEQPLALSLVEIVRTQLTRGPLNSCLKWFPEQTTDIIVVKRQDGKIHRRYRCPTMFFLHIINCYESEDQTLIVDVCTYKDAGPLEAMYVESIRTMQSNVNYASMFRARPMRYELPLNKLGNNMIIPTLFTNIGCETPRVYYEKYNGRKYRYFYAIGSDVDTETPGILIKVDTLERNSVTWSEKFCYPSEPIFVPNPDSKEEDDGILLSALVWSDQKKQVGLLVLDSKNMTEIARVTFQTPSLAPKCLHGWFMPNQSS